MSAFVGNSSYLWQKLAVNVKSDTNSEALQQALRVGATFFLIRLGLHTTREYKALLDRCNEAIRNYETECKPWTVSVALICELSGPQPRVKFGSGSNAVASAIDGQIITFTRDARYENQLFEEVKYVSNFNQLNEATVGNELSIGQVLLTVERIVPGHLTCRVLQGGTFESGSGVELVNPSPASAWQKEPESLCSAILEECKIVLEKGCRFVVLPNTNSSASYRAMLEAIRMKGLDRQVVQLIGNCDASIESMNRSEIRENFDGLLTNDVKKLKDAKAHKLAIILHLKTDQFPQFTEEADTIVVDSCNLTVLQNYLKRVNENRLRCDVVMRNSSIGPEDTPLVKCIQYAAREAATSAVILCNSSDVSLPTELAAQDILQIAFVIVRTSPEAGKLLLRKYLIPIVLPRPTSSTERMIRLAIAYGKRFGFLHGGNCVVSGFTAAPEADLGMELRYVPLNDAGVDALPFLFRFPERFASTSESDEISSKEMCSKSEE